MDANEITEAVLEQPNVTENHINNDATNEDEQDNDALDEQDNETIDYEEQDDNPNSVDDETQPATVTKSGRISRMPRNRYNMINVDDQIMEEYSTEHANIIAKILSYMHNQFSQRYSLKMGIQRFGEKGQEAVYEEMKQLHDRSVFKPIKVSDLSSLEKRRAMESLLFLVEKRHGRIKARTCANGSTQRQYIGKDDTTSPTVHVESILITATIDAKQGRDVMTADIPNAFVQADINQKGEKIIMKIRGALVQMLVDLDDTYQEYITTENDKPVLYLRMLKALHGMLQPSLLYYKKFKEDIEGIGFMIRELQIALLTANNTQ